MNQGSLVFRPVRNISTVGVPIGGRLVAALLSGASLSVDGVFYELSLS